MTRSPSSDQLLTHTHAAILSIGDELVLGQMLDTNSRAISQRLLDLGIPTVEHTTIADSLQATVDAVSRLSSIAPLLVVTGGLGPTADDLTREALAAVLGEPLVEDPESYRALNEMLRSRGRAMTPAQRLQALRPTSARSLANSLGTAPGLAARIGGACDAYFLPGPPNEWTPMFEAHVCPMLRLQPGRIVRTRLVQMIGLSEADAASRIPGLMDRSRTPLVGITASGGVLTWRIRYDGHAGAIEAERLIDETVALIRGAMGEYILPGHGGSLAESCIRELIDHQQTVACAESCTGGMLGGRLTDVPGSSSAFLGGWITYSNQSKVRDLGVRPETLERFGAVSAECVREMASGVLDRAGTSHAVAISGIAGPDGGTGDKPIGTVWIALGSRSTDGRTRFKERLFRITGSRMDVRERACTIALAWLIRRVGDELQGDSIALPWEQR